MKDKEAIILAGGLGTRIQEVLPGIPKCMALVQDKPFLTYVLDYLIQQQISKVILSVGYRKEQIINHFGNYYQSLVIEYVTEDEPLGTGGATKLALTRCTQDNVFVMNGDTYFRPDMHVMENLHKHTAASITIAVKFLDETRRYGVVISNKSGRITDFREKDPKAGSGCINGGIYLVNRQLLDDFQQPKFSLENDVFKTYCSTIHMQAFQSDAFFLDMGIPEDYTRAQTLLNSSLEL
jgi:D-glycero-alpha-D-manno-heptose 1-phosphate guanylyltransferase